MSNITLLFILFEPFDKEIFVTITDGAAEKRKQNTPYVQFCACYSHAVAEFLHKLRNLHAANFLTRMLDPTLQGIIFI
jgi:hypothetical protein